MNVGLPEKVCLSSHGVKMHSAQAA